jgi:hypothetical protein
MTKYIEALKSLLYIGEAREALTAAIDKLTEAFEPNTGLEWKTVHGSTSFGGSGVLGIRTQALSSKPLDWAENKALWRAAYQAQDLLEKAARQEILLADQGMKAKGEAETAELIACFEGPIYVEKIHNGYDPDYFVHNPWLIVTTTVGRFTIGWRKRVIHLEWGDVPGAGKGSDLFPDESTTTGDHYIHAWSIEKAKEYVAAVVASVLHNS